MSTYTFGGLPAPVLALVKRHEPLTEWARAARHGERCSHEVIRSTVPRNISPDPFFAPLPVKSAAPSLEFGDFEGCKHFLVRGFLDCTCEADLLRPLDDDVRVFADPLVASYRTSLGSEPVGTHRDVARKLQVAQLHGKGLDGSGVALAIVDSGINLRELSSSLGFDPCFSTEDSWAPENLALPPGHQPMGHGTMCAFGALIAAPKATLLDYPLLLARGTGTHALGHTICAALHAYARLWDIWKENRRKGYAAPYHALVVNNSWGILHAGLELFPKGHPGRYIDNPEHPFHRSVAALAREGVDILFAAGNCGKECPDATCLSGTTGTIMGANASASVLTIAGCDVHDRHVSYSSHGPSIDGMPRNKPDVAAYTHFLGSEMAEYRAPDGGTSTACAVASGCVAALRAKLPATQVRPATLFDTMRRTARRRKGTSWRADLGYGIVNPLKTADTLLRAPKRRT